MVHAARTRWVTAPERRWQGAAATQKLGHDVAPAILFAHERLVSRVEQVAHVVTGSCFREQPPEKLWTRGGTGQHCS